MKVTIDEDLCTGCALCEETAPDVFEMPEEIAKVKVDVVPADSEDLVRQAAEECPVECIEIEE